MSKRQAGLQITKDREEDDEDRGRDGPPDPAEDASAEVLATRKIALPRTRKKTPMQTEPVKQAANPFSFGLPTSQETPKSNPFAVFQSANKETGNPNVTSQNKSTPSFSFGTSSDQSATAKAAHVENENATNTSSAQSSTPQESATSQDSRQFKELLNLRSINVCFQKAMNDCLSNDAFADLTTICKEYQTLHDAEQSVPITAAKNDNGREIYPSFTTDVSLKTDRTSDTSTVHNAPRESQPDISSEIPAPKISFETKKITEQTPTPVFNFGIGGTKKADDSSSQTPTFTFGQKPTETVNHAEAPETAAETSAEAKIASTTPAKAPEVPANNFSWTPDRGIKFGDGSSTSTSGKSPSKFEFKNPLASPAQDSLASTEAPKFSFGANINTGFSFGQSTLEKKEVEDPASAPKAPTFNFSASAPTFTFGQSSTPSFSFQAPKKDEPNPAAAQADEDEGDAMPDEPRTNTALVAGPGPGEENEDEAHIVPRAKLYKFNNADPSKPWSDLGICIVRVVVHKETGKARLVARAEGAGAVRLNALMYAHFKYTLEGRSSVKVFDLRSDGKTDTYLLKLKLEADAQELVKVLNEKKV